MSDPKPALTPEQINAAWAAVQADITRHDTEAAALKEMTDQ